MCVRVCVSPQMSTVGYGDVVPVTPWEVVFVIAAMVCGCVCGCECSCVRVLTTARGHVPKYAYVCVSGHALMAVYVCVCVIERVCLCVIERVQILGALVFGYVAGTVGGAVSEMGQHSLRHSSKMQVCVCMCHCVCMFLIVPVPDVCGYVPLCTCCGFRGCVEKYVCMRLLEGCVCVCISVLMCV